MNEEYKKVWKEYLTEYLKDYTVKDNKSIYSHYNGYNDDYKLKIVDYTQMLKEKKEDPKVANEKILEKIPIAEIEKFLRKKKLENLKNKEE